jgi:hypothetical protein
MVAEKSDEDLQLASPGRSSPTVLFPPGSQQGLGVRLERNPRLESIGSQEEPFLPDVTSLMLGTSQGLIRYLEYGKVSADAVNQVSQHGLTGKHWIGVYGQGEAAAAVAMTMGDFPALLSLRARVLLFDAKDALQDMDAAAEVDLNTRKAVAGASPAGRRTFSAEQHSKSHTFEVAHEQDSTRNKETAPGARTHAVCITGARTHAVCITGARREVVINGSTRTEAAIKCSNHSEATLSSSTRREAAIKCSTRTDAAIKCSTRTETAISGSTHREAAIKCSARTEAAISGSTHREAAIKCSARTEAAIGGITHSEAAICVSTRRGAAIKCSTHSEAVIKCSTRSEAAFKCSTHSEAAFKCSTHNETAIKGINQARKRKQETCRVWGHANGKILRASLGPTGSSILTGLDLFKFRVHKT